MHLYPSYALLRRISHQLCIKVDLNFEVKQENLLLLSNGNRCLSLNFFDLVESDEYAIFCYLEFGYVFMHPVLGKLGEVLLLVEP